LYHQIWKFFTSIRLTVVLLLSLAATSIIGTLIPQNENAEAYVQAFGEMTFRMFSLLGLFDMYHSWWFQTLLLLLTVNIVVCSIDRLSATWDILFTRRTSFKVARFRNLKQQETFVVQRSPEQLKTLYQPFFKRAFRHWQLEKTETGYCIFGEKGRWTRLGVYTVHLSVVFLLIGGLIGSIFGFDGFVNIPEGESVKSIRIGNTGKILPLEFEIRCDDFDVSFYDSGLPKEYRSSLTILENGSPVVTKNIIVNDPLRYKGVSLYQSSYGSFPPNKAVLSFISKKTGMVYQKEAVVGELVELPEQMGTFVLEEWQTAANFRGQNIGEAFSGSLTPLNGNPQGVLLPIRFPSFDKMRRGELTISVAELKPRYYTGLQVNRDPGVGLVYVGFIVMILGCYVTFFMSHQQVCVEVVRTANHSKVIVSGKANKNKMGMQNRVKAISEKLVRLGPREKPTGSKGIGQKAESAAHRA